MVVSVVGPGSSPARFRARNLQKSRPTPVCMAVASRVVRQRRRENAQPAHGQPDHRLRTRGSRRTAIAFSLVALVFTTKKTPITNVVSDVLSAPLRPDILQSSDRVEAVGEGK